MIRPRKPRAVPEAVRLIEVYQRTRGATAHCWNVGDGGMLLTQCGAAIQAAVDRKVRKLERRAPQPLPPWKECGRCWLLVGVRGDDPSSFMDPAAEVRERIYSARFFERVFFLNAVSGAWFELRLGR